MRLGGFGGPGGPGGFGAPGMPGGGPGGPFGAPDPIAVAQAELQALLDKKETAPDLLKEKVAALRTAKAKVHADLAEAKKELQLLVTPDQEAILVGQGYLD